MIASGSAFNPRARDHRRPIAVWLLVCAALIFAMALLGGATRLTDSGLSMVEWRIEGVLPPATEGEWEAAFDKYKQFPEYKKLRPWMVLDDFKRIYWFEYSHRTLGRIIGIFFVAPLIFFVAARRVERRLAIRLAAVLGLGGLQGLLGWFMVQSGLVDRPAVSHYRLAVHLGLAVALYGYLIWIALDLLHPVRLAGWPSPGAVALLALVFITILSGALVAGLDAGFAYGSFPLMDGRMIPADLFAHSPWYANFTENVVTVQFDHRILGVVTAIFVVGQWLYRRRLHRGRHAAFDVLPVVVCGQVGLGIATLLLAVPVSLAIAHQAGALMLITAALVAAHATALPASGRLETLAPDGELTARSASR
jgi:cytochrome c oxidase assembly protein subunit 15